MEKNLEKIIQNEVEYEEIEGYASCSTAKQKCLYDCWPMGNAVFSTID